MEVQWGKVVATGEVEGEGGRPFAVVAGLPHRMDLGDGEVDGLPGLGRSQGLEEGRGRGRRREGERRGRRREGEGRGEHIGHPTMDKHVVTPHAQTSVPAHT